MPERKGFARKIARPDDFLFSFGDGLYNLCPGDAVYATAEKACDRWVLVRREVWAQMNRFRIPGGAQAFDNLTKNGLDLLWARGTRHLRITSIDVFGASEILAAFDSDRAAVARFRRDDPEGVGQINDYLDLYLEDIAFGCAETRRIEAQLLARKFPSVPNLVSRLTYGSSLDGAEKEGFRDFQV